MKRSPLQRKTPLASGPGPARKPMSRKPKAKASNDCRWRSPDYLAFVRSLPCCLCGASPCDAHHLIGLGWGLSGMGLTAPDSFAMPLCRHHHQLTHANSAIQGLQPQWLKATIRAAFQAGVSPDARDELTHALALIAEKETV